MSTPTPPEPRPAEPTLAAPEFPPATITSIAVGPPASTQFRELRETDLISPRRRAILLPVVLFIATCFSTFWVGAADWRTQRINDPTGIGPVVSANWQQGLTYMGAVLAILLTHEMGHFLQTVRYHIPASYPLCIPVPFSLIGTMGAVISMDGTRANRKQIFDIGIAGPLAGLVVAAPILYLGVRQLDLSVAADPHDIQLYNPVIVRWLIEWMHPQWAEQARWVSVSQLNPFFMAGWVGMLITGLNMLPVSQLDGGHTIYALFGRDAYKIARAFTIVAIIYVVLNLDQAIIWTPMLILVILLGIHHPPTSDDTVELDDFRWVLGVASMAIPVLCFPLQALKP